MQNAAMAALEATRSIRSSRAFAGLPAAEQLALDADLRRIEGALSGSQRLDRAIFHLQ